MKLWPVAAQCHHISAPFIRESMKLEMKMRNEIRNFMVHNKDRCQSCHSVANSCWYHGFPQDGDDTTYGNGWELVLVPRAPRGNQTTLSSSHEGSCWYHEFPRDGIFPYMSETPAGTMCIHIMVIMTNVISGSCWYHGPRLIHDVEDVVRESSCWYHGSPRMMSSQCVVVARAGTTSSLG